MCLPILRVSKYVFGGLITLRSQCHSILRVSECHSLRGQCSRTLCVFGCVFEGLRSLFSPCPNGYFGCYCVLILRVSQWVFGGPASSCVRLSLRGECPSTNHVSEWFVFGILVAIMCPNVLMKTRCPKYPRKNVAVMWNKIALDYPTLLTAQNDGLTP